jgi:hypothetical protein
LIKPNLFIAGAPRCGTTSMWSYLKDHPQVFMSEEKELYFFDSDLWTRKEWAPTLEQYLANFSAAGDRKVVGEATPSYLRSPRAPEAIKRFNPEARIVIMLRNPLDVMYSLHSQGLRYGTEPISDFEAALQADAKRVGRESLGYREFTSYPGQIRRYFRLFGRETVHTIIFDDMSASPGAVYRELLRFLGVDPGFIPNFKIVNANINVLNWRLQTRIAHPPQALRRIAHAVLPKPLRSRIQRSLVSSNLREAPRAPMGPELRKRLQKEFEPQVEELSRLLGRDLSGWSRSDDAGQQAAASSG